MIALQQSDPVMHADLFPISCKFNTVINRWQSPRNAMPSKAEEMLVAMNQFWYVSGMPKPGNQTLLRTPQ
jgi:hypothetical protein